MSSQTINDGKTASVVAYLTIIGSVIAIILNHEKKNTFVAFHCRQGLGLCLTYMLIGFFISQFDSFLISSAFWIGFAMLFFYGLISAISGATRTVPILGPLYQKLFANIGN